ncbi:P-loop NTPase fold protein [Actinokineospora auranticolor]|uniref:KAP-like P-loop domain-containing protein n=1 Tax=Actinokineospora auranticolor TaxID=155976 RepID=A0A2S6GZ60_9PSEU|nr:P-loop NTPase fold protein [Actinokineospora auranticolor]PPK70524.1 KAP-like P-loop domain-containing protein [Actinokineospora auranticolor]
MDLALAAPDSRVLLIIAGYAAEDRLSPMPLSTSRVHRVRRALLDRCGVTPDRLLVVTEPERPDYVAAIAWAVAGTRRLLVYYSGHSHLDGETHLAQGSSVSGVTSTWFPVSVLTNAIASSDVETAYLALETGYARHAPVGVAPRGYLLAAAGSAYSAGLADVLTNGIEGGPPTLTFRQVADRLIADMARDDWKLPVLTGWGEEDLPFVGNAAARDHTADRLGPVRIRGFGDQRADRDLLDRAHLVTVLADTLREPPDNDRGPTVVTIEGPWGSGKSTLLDLVKREVSGTCAAPPPDPPLRVARACALLRRPPPEPAREPRPGSTPVVVEFNSWLYQSDQQVWAGLARELTKAVEDAVYPDAESRQRFWFTRNLGKIDRPGLRRAIWRRIRSPLLAAGTLALGIPVASLLARDQSSGRFLGLTPGWFVLLPAALLVAGLTHTAYRFFRGRAASFLPSELFHGPLTSGAFTQTAPPTDPAVRDPYYHARSGYLYLTQHDVGELLGELAGAGRHLVVFIDDLDRCLPHTTAEVLSAINVFICGGLPRTRFVIGLDPGTVAAHIDHSYRDLADGGRVRHPHDPSPGWTFLRKLVQLPVRLPAIAEEATGPVLDHHLGPVQHQARGTMRELDVRDDLSTTDTATAVPVVAEAPSAVEAVPLERHPVVRGVLRRRLAAQESGTVREYKRLITVWQFYLRVVTLADGAPSVDRACELIAVAELATRWPGYQDALGKVVGGGRGLGLLAAAVDDDLEWDTVVGRLGFGHSDREAASGIRALLREFDAVNVAALSQRLR